MQDPALYDTSLLSPGSTPIGEDEPVVLFRAQDKFMREVLTYYRALVVSELFKRPKEVREVVDSIDGHIERVNAWQHEHGCKSPDL
jgi:hypothetical protein